MKPVTGRFPDRCRRLVTDVCDVLARGIHIDAGVWHYMASMGWDASPDRLTAVLSASGDWEADSLIELIFFPDEAVQLRLEALLETHVFDAADQQAIIDQLSRYRPRVTVHVAPDIPALCTPMPEAAIGPFVNRLRITHNLAPDLKKAIETHTAPGNQTRLKVRFRNCDLAQTVPEVDFLSLFFRKMDAHSPGFLSYVDFILAFLGECPGESDYHSALRIKRQTCEQQEKMAVQFESRLATSNMETLMLQGIRPPAIRATEARKTMRLIDTICTVLYG